MGETTHLFLFDRRYALVRLPVMLALAGGYLILVAGSPHTVWDFAFALASVALCVLGAAWPLAALTGQAALLAAVGALAGPDAAVVVKIATSIALFELAVRRPARQVVAGTAAVVGGYVLHVFDRLPEGLPPLLYRLAIVVGAPLALAAYIRVTRELAVQAEERAVTESRRAEAESCRAEAESRRAEAEARRAEAEVRRRGSEARAARAGERVTLARELHDLVAHHLASMVLRIGVARHVLPDLDPRVTETLDDVHASGTAVLGDLRRLVAVLRDPGTLRDGPGIPLVEPEGLVVALETAADRGRQIGLMVDTSLDTSINHLDAMRALTVLRLSQEGITNAAKHAGPSARVRLSVLVEGDGAVQLEIADDGGTQARDTQARDTEVRDAGVRDAEVRDGEVRDGELRVGEVRDGGVRDGGGCLVGRGYGLIGMRERVELLGGRFRAGACGAGWRLSATLPQDEPVRVRP